MFANSSHWQLSTHKKAENKFQRPKVAIFFPTSLNVNCALRLLEVETSSEAPSGRQPWPLCVDDFTFHILCCADCFNLPWRVGGDWIPPATELSHTHADTYVHVFTDTHTTTAHGDAAHMAVLFISEPHAYIDMLLVITIPGSDFNLAAKEFCLLMDQLFITDKIRRTLTSNSCGVCLSFLCYVLLNLILFLFYSVGLSQ